MASTPTTEGLVARPAGLARHLHHGGIADGEVGRAAEDGREGLGVAAGGGDEQNVHGAALFDPAVLGAVQPDHLLAAVLGRLAGGEQAGRVVAAALGRPGAAGGRAGEEIGRAHV